MILDFTEAAVSDLRSIRNYTLKTWGAEQEQIYLDLLWDKFDEILRDPQRWRHREDLFPGCQIAAQGKHVILFRIRGKILQVVRILHSAMELPSHIPDDLGGASE